MRLTTIHAGWELACFDIVSPVSRDAAKHCYHVNRRSSIGLDHPSARNSLPYRLAAPAPGVVMVPRAEKGLACGMLGGEANV